MKHSKGLYDKRTRFEHATNDELKNELRGRGYILGSPFRTDDIKSIAKKIGKNLSEEEVEMVHQRIEDTFDANIGINWEVIEQNIWEVL